MKTKFNYQKEMERLQTALGCDLVALACVEPAEQQYVLKWQYAAGNLNDRFKRVVLQSGKGVAGLVFKTGKPILLPTVTEFVQKDGLFNYPIIKSEKLKSVAAVPIWNHGRVAGVLLSGSREEYGINEVILQQMTEAAHKGFGDMDGKELMVL
ncbi:GAF domain-containing protein [Planococcus lenghuensis]|uniref:GAF domain-containing protein n=1 Tax=Planococcus lenghuensis TaxID=2213202 RepID=A0A1Q2KUP5_9BACL|nr:GAF domain-containing protein [Planococcus lenghuensis]AQQ51935.1 GAF domain-containing protein [Planococcus lenghuensis]